MAKRVTLQEGPILEDTLLDGIFQEGTFQEDTLLAHARLVWAMAHPWPGPWHLVMAHDHGQAKQPLHDLRMARLGGTAKFSSQAMAASMAWTMAES